MSISKIVNNLLTVPDGCEKLSIDVGHLNFTYDVKADEYDYSGQNIPEWMKENVLTYMLSLSNNPKVVCRYTFAEKGNVSVPIYLSYIPIFEFKSEGETKVYTFTLPIQKFETLDPMIFEPPKLVRQVGYCKTLLSR